MPPRADVRTIFPRSFSSAADACRSAALAGLGGLDELDSAVAVVVCAAASLGGWTGERAAAALTRRVVRRTPDPLAPLFLLDDAELQVDGVRRAALVVLAVPGLAAARARRGGAAVRHGPHSAAESSSRRASELVERSCSFCGAADAAVHWARGRWVRARCRRWARGAAAGSCVRFLASCRLRVLPWRTFWFLRSTLDHS